MVKAFENFEVWFITGAQLLYGGDAVVQVDGHSKEMVDGLNQSGKLPIKIVYKGTANSSKEVSDLMSAANNDKKCVGVITWMHTFSPAKMWIHGMQALKKPLLHLHTQYNRQIPWQTMDMDFMNRAHTAIESMHTFFRACVRTTKRWWDIGKTTTHKNVSQYGRVFVRLGQMRKTCSLYASATR